MWSKKQADGAVAVLIVAMAGPAELTLRLSNYIGGEVAVRDLWSHKETGRHTGTMRFPVQLHTSSPSRAAANHI